MFFPLDGFDIYFFAKWRPVRRTFFQMTTCQAVANRDSTYCCRQPPLKDLTFYTEKNQMPRAFLTYRISSFSFRGNYSFLNLEIQKAQYLRSKVTVHKCAETVQGRKLFKGGNYMRKYGSSKTIYDGDEGVLWPKWSFHDLTILSK